MFIPADFLEGQGLSTFFADLTQIGKATVSQRGCSQDLVEEHMRLLETSKKTLDVV
jgi:hypothetical protein